MQDAQRHLVIGGKDGLRTLPPRQYPQTCGPSPLFGTVSPFGSTPESSESSLFQGVAISLISQFPMPRIRGTLNKGNAPVALVDEMAGGLVSTRPMALGVWARGVEGLP